MKAAVVTVFKGERPEYLREWVAFHLTVGFDLAYLLCNDADPDVSYLAVRSFCESGRARFAPFPDVKFLQTVGYTRAFAELREEYEWCCFVDSDELVVPDGASVKETFRLFDSKRVGAVMMHWKVFHSGGLATHPARVLQIEAYTSRLKTENKYHRTLKTALRTVGGKRPVGSHHWELLDGFHPVNSLGRRLSDCSHEATPIIHDRLHINHYVTRSRQDYAEKIERGWPSGGGSRKISPENRWKIWDLYHAESVRDDCAVRFAPAVRAMLEANP